MIKIIKYAIYFVFLALGAWFIARPCSTSGDCMEPAIIDGEVVFVNQLAPYIRDYKIGDIVVFEYENKPWYSRVVALPYDIILIKKNEIFVNEKIINEDKIVRNWQGWDFGVYGINEPYKVPGDCVYVLSDNLSAQHDDSRVFKAINLSSITGLVWK